MKEAMLKNMLVMMGVDPEQIMQQITQFATFAQQGAETMARVEQKIDALNLRLDAMDATLRRQYGQLPKAPTMIDG